MSIKKRMKEWRLQQHGEKKELANLDLKNPCCLKIHPNKLQDTKNVIFLK